MGYGYSGHTMMGGAGYGIVHAVFSVFWVVILILAIVWLVRMLRGGGHRHRHWRHWTNDALSILEERYAKGEIDKAEFEEKRKVLEG